ncbi:hypothetical protein Tsubulata_034056 [Turnera subulata]|uniref:Protein kinase domain-containing protein n=1 Tax=Turnera subulata TaxID=218843 RepID=A0A9Q0FDQ2_9ROSI|nr:hypothetical protein Tsubulata_034056 [Turnera subulata]
MVKTVRSAKYPMDVVVKEFEMAEKTRQQRKRIDEQFTREVQLHDRINQFEHPNIVRLIGYGAWCGKRAILTEYIPNRRLIDHLTSLPPNHTRVQIALDVALVLQYLHGLLPPILHSDIKPENIMLGHNNTPKVIDFGCSIEVRGNAAMMRGRTPEYAGPEWQRRLGRIGLPFDVHCLGMVMLELMTGRRAVEPEVDLHLRALVKETPEEALASNDYQVLWAEVHQLIADGMPRHKFVAMMNLIMQCCRNEAEDRPNIDVVVQRLEAILNPW